MDQICANLVLGNTLTGSFVNVSSALSNCMFSDIGTTDVDATGRRAECGNQPGGMRPLSDHNIIWNKTDPHSVTICICGALFQIPSGWHGEIVQASPPISSSPPTGSASRRRARSARPVPSRTSVWSTRSRIGSITGYGAVHPSANVVGSSSDAQLSDVCWSRRQRAITPPSRSRRSEDTGTGHVGSARLAIRQHYSLEAELSLVASSASSFDSARPFLNSF